MVVLKIQFKLRNMQQVRFMPILHLLKKWLTYPEFISGSKIEILKRVQNDIIFRKCLFFILIFLFFSFSTERMYASPANKPLILQGTIITPVAEILKEPKDGAEFVTTLQKEANVEIRGTSLDDKWLFLSTSDKKHGWIKKEKLNYNTPENLNFELVKVIGEEKGDGVLIKAGLVYANNDFLYVLDSVYPYNLLKFTFDGQFIQNIPITYSWVKDKSQLNDIVLSIDKENIYTNASAQNILSQYSEDGKVKKDIIKEGISSIKDVFYETRSKQIYCLDVKEKSVKLFTEEGKLNKLIFLSQSKNPKKITIDVADKNIYVLDSTPFYDTYIVKADILNVRSSPGTDASIIATAKSDSFIKVLPEKVESKDESKYKWVKIELSENNYGYIALDFLQKIKAAGEIQIYSYEGEFKSTISLKNTLSHQLENNFRLYVESDLNRIINDINFSSSSGLLVSMTSLVENTDVSSINICKIEGENFITYESVTGNLESRFAISSLKFFVSNSFGTVSVFNNEGNYLNDIGQNVDKKPAVIKLLGINKDDNIIIFDQRLNTISMWKDFKILKEINLLKEKVSKTESWSLFNTNEQNIIIGETVYNDVNLIRFLEIPSSGEINYSPFLFSTPPLLKEGEGNIIPCMGINNNNEKILAITKGKSLYGEGFMEIFTKNNTPLRIWKIMDEILTLFPSEEQKKINSKDAEIIGFNQKGEGYIKLRDKKSSTFVLYRLLLNSKEQIEVLDKINFYDALESSKSGFPAIKKIIRSDYGFTYILYMDKTSKLAIFSPTGNLAKHITTDKHLQDIIIDSKNNIFIADYFGVYSLLIK